MLADHARTPSPARALRHAMLIAACVCAQGSMAQGALRGAASDSLIGSSAAAAAPLRVVDGQLPARAPGSAGDGQVWRQSMLWQERDQAQIGLGVAVRTAVRLQGPLAAQRGADTTGVNGSAGGSPDSVAGPAMALLAVERPVTPGLSVGMGMSLPLGAQTAPAGMRDARVDGAAADGRGEVRWGLSFSNRSAAGDMRNALSLRMQLSGATALTLRPRGGGRVLVQLSSQW